jgi:co-chaperonin GroES (HSP10)
MAKRTIKITESQYDKIRNGNPRRIIVTESQIDRINELNEVIELPIEVGDEVLMGKFRNKKVKVKDIDTDEFGHPTINGKKILNLRITKLMNKKGEE